MTDDLIEYIEYLQSNPKCVNYNDSTFWAPEPDWTQEDEDLYREWVQMDFEWHEDVTVENLDKLAHRYRW